MRAQTFNGPRLIDVQDSVAVIAAVWIFVGLASCTVGPDYVTPQGEVPDDWHQAAVQGLVQGDAVLEEWWTVFNDPGLDALIAQAAKGNRRLEIALHRVREARAIVGVASGALVPTVDGVGSYERSRISPNGLMAPLLQGGDPDQSNLHRIGFDSSWEIDVFGGIRRGVELSQAGLQASVENYRDTLVSLYAEVALNYVEVRTLQARLRYARSNVESQRATLELTRARRDAGIAPDLDVSQAESNLSRSEAQIPVLEIALVTTINRLGVLTGQPPGALHERLGTPASIPAPPKDVAVGLPTELLRQRPDIRRTERQVAAATAQIGVATAGLYPRFSLSGTFVLEATTVRDLGNISSRAWSFGPALRWNLFDGLRNIYRIRGAEAVTDQALAEYEQTVLRALEEVENAMVAYKYQQVRRAALQRSVAATERSIELVKKLYETGLTDFQNVLDTERSLFDVQDDLADSEGLVTVDLISLYKALGGGWAIEDQASLQAEERGLQKRESMAPGSAPSMTEDDTN
jgi:NodT family efflux transporter outer membrane factor (OMF) lipoprotein